MSIFLQALLDGLAIGSTYVLLAVGFGLIYGVLGLLDFAYGDIVVWAAYIGVACQEAGFPLVASVIVMVVGGTTLSIITAELVFRPLVAAEPLTLLLASIGLAFVLESAATLVFSPDPHSTVTWRTLQDNIKLFPGTTMSLNSFVTLGSALVLLTALVFSLQRTRAGLALRAVAERHDVAQLMGISVRRTYWTAFGVSGAIAGVVAFLWLGEAGTVSPTSGLNLTLVAFVSLALGGAGGVTGAVYGGLILGVASSLLGVYLPSSLTGYQDALTFGAVAVILSVRPYGVTGKVVDTSR